MKKTIGISLLTFGVILGIVAFNVDTTVSTSGGRRVHNIGLMDDRRNALLVAALAIAIGVILVAFHKSGETAPRDQSERPSTATGQDEAPARLFPSQRSLDLDSYQLYLVKKYNIEKNDVLSKFVVSETLFQTIEEALRFAHALDVEAEERERADRARREEMEAAIEMERLRVESSTRLRDPPPHTWPAAQSASTGAKFIFVAVSLAVIALLSQGSFIVFIAGEGGVALLVMVLVFAGWAYTIVSIVRKRPLNRPLVVTCAVASFLLGALFAFVSGDSKFGDAHDFGAALLFAFASCLLAVGALKYRVASPEPLQIGRKA